MLLFRHSEGDQQTGKSVGVSHRFVCTKSQSMFFLSWHSISLPQQSTLIPVSIWDRHWSSKKNRTQTLRSPLVTGRELGKQQLDRHVSFFCLFVVFPNKNRCLLFIFLLFKCQVFSFFEKISHGNKGTWNQGISNLKLQSKEIWVSTDSKRRFSALAAKWFKWRPCHVLCWVGCGWMVKIWLSLVSYSRVIVCY